MAEWYYANNGVEQGPIARADFAALVRDGTIGPQTLVWTNTLREWEPAHLHIDGVAGARPPVPTASGAGVAAARNYRRESGLGDAFRQFFNRYVQFSGRSNRGEFWFWQLDNLLITFGLGVLDMVIFGTEGSGVLGGLWGLATLIPSFALGARRLHDIDKSGWWQLLMLIPLLGWIILLVWFCRAPDDRPNRFG